MGPRLASAVVLAAAALAATPALAQGVGDVALGQLEPSQAGDPFVGVPSPFIGGHLVPRVAALIDHASEPLVLTTDDGGEGTVVGSQTLLHVGASLSVLDRLRADLSLPIALAQGGDSPVLQGAELASPTSAAVGDLRFGVRIRVLGEEEDPFQLAGGVQLHVPTGKAGVYVGEGALREAPQLLLGGRLPYFVWSASLGALVRSSHNPSMLTYGGGAAAVLLDGALQVGPEVFAATPLQDAYLKPGDLRSTERERLTNAEVLLSARARLPLGFIAMAGGGLGLSDAIGTPAFRIVGAVGWELPVAAAGDQPSDTDADGIADADDACPYAFGPTIEDAKRSGCPADQPPAPAGPP